MTTFKEWLLNEQPLGGDPGGAGIGGAPPPMGGDPMGGGLGGPPPGGGDLGGLGGAPPPMGGDPMGGMGAGMGAAPPGPPQPPQKLKTYDVWTTLEELLGMSSSKKSKDKLQSPQQKQKFQGLMS